jgi:hypothetical protein
MRRRWQAVVTTLLATLPAAASFTFPAQRRGNVEAVLEVSLADKTGTPGQAAVTYTVRLTGPAGLEAEPLRLGDATGVWKPAWQGSAWAEEGSGTVIEETVRLQQGKPGAAPLPDVKARFRENPEASWDEVEWLEVLRQVRDVPPPEGLTPPAPPGRGWLTAAAGVGAAVLLACGWILRRRRGPAAPPLPPGARALAELARLDKELAATEGTVFHTQLADVIRRYLAERFGLPAPERTGAEVLEDAQKVPALGGPAREVLCEFLERCDLAKFAHSGVGPDDCRRTAALARELVERSDAHQSGPPLPTK